MKKSNRLVAFISVETDPWTFVLACSSLRFFGRGWIGVCAAALYAHFRGMQRIALLRPCGRWLVSVACFMPDIFLYGGRFIVAVNQKIL